MILGMRQVSEHHDGREGENGAEVGRLEGRGITAGSSARRMTKASRDEAEAQQPPWHSCATDVDA